MGPVAGIGLLWAGFMATHILLSSARARPALLARLGAQGFQGVYSLVALAFFVPLIWVFATHKHAGPVLWYSAGPPAVAGVLNRVLMTFAVVLFVSSLLPSSTPPSAMQARGPAAARGIVRVTRHPSFVALALFGLAHLLVNGTLGDVLFFAGFPAFAWIGALHQDSRKAVSVPGYAEVMRVTSIVPFAAVLRGRQRLRAAELPVVAVAVGVLLTVVLRTFHSRLFGP